VGVASDANVIRNEEEDIIVREFERKIEGEIVPEIQIQAPPRPHY